MYMTIYNICSRFVIGLKGNFTQLNIYYKNLFGTLNKTDVYKRWHALLGTYKIVGLMFLCNLFNLMFLCNIKERTIKLKRRG